MGKIIHLVVLFSFASVSSALALDCEYSVFEPNQWNGSVFKAETIEDTNDYTKVRIMDCIKTPCNLGNAVVKKEYWGFGRPKSNKGDVLVWTVQATEKTNEFKIEVCTTPTENFWK